MALTMGVGIALLFFAVVLPGMREVSYIAGLFMICAAALVHDIVAAVKAGK